MEFGAFEYVLLFISFSLVVMTMAQSAKTDGASGALMGGGLNLFQDKKERGIEKIFSHVTIYLGIGFILIAILAKM